MEKHLEAKIKQNQPTLPSRLKKKIVKLFTKIIKQLNAEDYLAEVRRKVLHFPELLPFLSLNHTYM